ncbi:MAG: glycosyltransferase family 2 protein [Acidobacteriota bacterium]|nr:glycosyltransferase family 2 protein [Acidobacteriota bacterium]
MAGASVSILIPARDEERSIEACVRSALASTCLDLEVIVLDDHSTDRTSEIVNRIAMEDRRLRLVSAPPLPNGWCGKQFSCSVLGGLASKPILCFLDADVRLTSDGLMRMVGAMRNGRSALISGFPWQETRTPLEQMLIPLMHFLLLGYLPIFRMRRRLEASLGAGCGQIFVADRVSYLKAGGHAALRSSRHDGIMLPRAFRRAGLMTDLCDATDVASCRMYSNAHEVVNGLLKNATEGLASATRIVPFSILLLVGQVAPVVLLLVGPQRIRVLAGTAAVLAYLPRLIATYRFRQPLLGALLHPVSIALLLGIQWLAFLRAAFGFPSTWKGRISTNV